MSIKRSSDRAIIPGQSGVSRLLLLPAELRNAIYELACTSNDDGARPQRIFTINPPSRALLATSRRIYNEARAFYHEAWRLYWATRHFTVNVKELSFADKKRFPTLQECGFLQPLQNLCITTLKPSDRSRGMTFELEDRRGGWKVIETVQWVALRPKYLVVQPQASNRCSSTWRTSDRAKMEWACHMFKTVEGIDRQILAAIWLLEDWGEGVKWS